MSGNNNILEDPKGLDFAIQRLQNLLFSDLSWTNIQMHGRVDKIPNPDNTSFKPYAFFGGNDYKNVERDDNFTGNIFFVANDQSTSDNGISFTNSVDIVFMVNLRGLYPGYIGRASELAQKDAVMALANQTAFTITSIGSGVDEALGDLYKEDVKFTDMQPNHVFRITGNLNFLLNC